MTSGDRRRGLSAPRVLGLVVVSLFILYNLNFRDGGGLDAFGSTLVPGSILSEGDFDLDEYRGWLQHDLPAYYSWGLRAFGSVQVQDGHLLSSYPPGGALLATPIYALPFALGWLDDWHAMRIAGKVSASLMVALSAGFLFLTLRQQLALRPALALTAAYALGTPAWSIASQGMWQHGPGLLCLTIALLAATRLESGAGTKTAVLAGAALGFAVIVRTTNIVPAFALALFVCVRHRRHLVAFAVPAALLATWLVGYNLTTFGTLSGGYDAVYGSAAHSWRNHDLSSVFSNPLGYGLASVLLSPSKGLLAYSPHLVVGLLAGLVFWRWKQSPLAPYLALWSLLTVVLLAKNRLWWGGTSFGPRYFCELTPALTLLIAAAWPWLRAQRVAFAAFGTAVVLGISIQGLGAFFAPCGWATTPVTADQFPERHWDFSDPEIVRCLVRGLEQGPLPPELLQPQTSRR